MSAPIDLKSLKPYGDTTDDGAVQFSFTLPIEPSARAKVLYDGLAENAYCRNRHASAVGPWAVATRSGAVNSE